MDERQSRRCNGRGLAERSKAIVTAIAAGTAHITASVRGHSASATVTVSTATLQSIVIAPSNASFPGGFLALSRARAIQRRDVARHHRARRLGNERWGDFKHRRGRSPPRNAGPSACDRVALHAHLDHLRLDQRHCDPPHRHVDGGVGHEIDASRRRTNDPQRSRHLQRRFYAAISRRLVKAGGPITPTSRFPLTKEQIRTTSSGSPPGRPPSSAYASKG